MNACCIQGIRNAIGVADKLVNFFDGSAQREHLLKEEIKKTDSSKSKLHRFCRTRWVERHDAYDLLIELLPCVIYTLETVKDTFQRREAVTDATCLIRSVTFEFLIALIISARALNFIQPLSVQLQGQALDVVQALQHVEVTVRSIKDAREKVDEFHDRCFNEASAVAEKIDVEVKKPGQMADRKTGKTMRRTQLRSTTSGASLFCFWIN